MNIKKHTASSRGSANHGWLQANHSFSFARYHNPDKMQFGALRVLNDDVVAPSMGFAEHPHKNMEIITIPLQGVLKHKDNMSNDWIPVKPNEVQIMSAGTGVFHSEMNATADEYLKLFQIWIIPNKEEVKPRYDQKMFLPEDRKNKQQIVVSAMNDDYEGLKIYQDALISRIDLDENSTFEYQLKSAKHGVYVMNISGEIKLENEIAATRDAIAVSETESFTIQVVKNSELLLIEVPM